MAHDIFPGNVFEKLVDITGHASDGGHVASASSVLTLPWLQRLNATSQLRQSISQRPNFPRPATTGFDHTLDSTTEESPGSTQWTATAGYDLPDACMTLGATAAFGAKTLPLNVYMRLRSAFPPPPPMISPPPSPAKASTVTGMGPFAVAILVAVIVFDA